MGAHVLAHVLDRAAIRRGEPLRQNYLDMVLVIFVGMVLVIFVGMGVPDIGHLPHPFNADLEVHEAAF